MSILKVRVWLKAVKEMEDRVIQVCPSLVGGRGLAESTEQYADRCMHEIQQAVKNLEIARRELDLAKKEAVIKC